MIIVNSVAHYTVRHRRHFVFMNDFPKQRIEKLIEEMHSYKGSGVGERHQHPVMATIYAIIAEEQAKSAEKLERQTDTLSNLTRRLFQLTWILELRFAREKQELIFTPFSMYSLGLKRINTIFR